MQGHVERQLARARLAPFNAKASADAGAVAEQVVRVMSRTPAGERLTSTVAAPKEMFVRIDSQDLSEALGNLIENAVRHARSRISVSVRAEGDDIEAAVTDDGPGIPAEQWEKMLERDARLDELASGAGLGLSIVKDIAESWGATGGFTVRLRLPKASPPA
jgi:signal transduction histidine kinase